MRIILLREGHNDPVSPLNAAAYPSSAGSRSDETALILGRGQGKAGSLRKTDERTEDLISAEPGSDGRGPPTGRRAAIRRRALAEGGEVGRPLPLLMNPGSDLLSHAVASAVPSAQEGLTSVFGMGTGVAPPVRPPGTL